MYQAAEALAAEVERLLPEATRAGASQADHLERSADSVLFNMAEGIGAFQPKVKTNAYGIARREASELRAVLRRLEIKRVFTRAEIDKAYNLAGVCLAMLTRAIITIERSDRSPRDNKQIGRTED